MQKEGEFSQHARIIYLRDFFLISSFQLRFGQVLSINFQGNTEYAEIYRSSPQYPQANLEIVPSISLADHTHISRAGLRMMRMSWIYTASPLCL